MISVLFLRAYDFRYIKVHLLFPLVFSARTIPFILIARRFPFVLSRRAIFITLEIFKLIKCASDFLTIKVDARFLNLFEVQVWFPYVFSTRYSFVRLKCAYYFRTFLRLRIISFRIKCGLDFRYFSVRQRFSIVLSSIKTFYVLGARTISIRFIFAYEFNTF